MHIEIFVMYIYADIYEICIRLTCIRINVKVSMYLPLRPGRLASQSLTTDS